MVGILLVTHGGLAEELLATASVIAGSPPACEALSLDWTDTLEGATAKVGAAVARLDGGDGVLVLTDLVGDTPYNAALRLFTPGQVEVVTGVNLAMILRLSCLLTQKGDVAELAAWIRVKGRDSICLASELARPRATAAAAVPCNEESR